MINNEQKSVTVISYSSGVDTYGQKRTSQSSTRTTDMMVKIFSQENVKDPRYVDVELIGITKDTSITTDNRVQIDGDTYNVLYIIPSRRFYSVLMKKI